MSRRNGNSEHFWCRRNGSRRNGSRRNGTNHNTGVGEMGVGEMGVGETGTSPVIMVSCSIWDTLRMFAANEKVFKLFF